MSSSLHPPHLSRKPMQTSEPSPVLSPPSSHSWPHRGPCLSPDLPSQAVGCGVMSRVQR